MPFDDTDKKTIQDMIGDALKGEAFATAVAPVVSSALKGLKLEDTITSAVEKAVGARDDADKAASDTSDSTSTGQDDELAKVRRQLEAMDKKFQGEREAREKAEAARQQDALRSDARDALVQAGVPAERVRHALVLLEADGLLAAAEDGSPGIKGKDRYGVEAVLPLAEGLATWVKTDDGKSFLPPTNAQGDGSSVGSGRPSVKGADGQVNTDALRSLVAGGLVNAMQRVEV